MLRRKNRRSKRSLGFEAVEAREALTNLLPMDADPGDVGPPAETSSMVDDDTIPPDDDSTVGGGGG